MRRVSLCLARVSAWGEFGDDVFIALFSGLFDRYTAKATASSFPRILGLVGSGCVQWGTQDGAHWLMCCNCTCTKLLPRLLIIGGFPDPSANQHGTYVPHTLPSNYTGGE